MDRKRSAERSEEGELKGRVELVTRLLRRRFGKVPSELAKGISHLTIKQIDNLAESLFDFKSVDDVHSWMAQL